MLKMFFFNKLIPLKSLTKHSTDLDDTSNYLLEHMANYEPVMKELLMKDMKKLLKKDLDTLLAYPENSEARLKFVKKSLMDCTNPDIRRCLSPYNDVLNEYRFPISDDVRQEFQLEPRQMVFNKIDQLKAVGDIESIDIHLPSILNKLKPLFMTINDREFNIILETTNLCEKAALLLFEPILLTCVGITAFCKIIIPLFFKEGSFIKLINLLENKAYKWVPYTILPMKTLLNKIITSSPFMLRSPTISALTIVSITGIASVWAAIGPSTSSGSLVTALNTISAPPMSPEPLRTILVTAKQSLETVGAESFRISTALVKGALHAVFYDNKEFLIELLKWLESSKPGSGGQNT